MLTPSSELPQLPKLVRSYWPIHAYTLTQIIVTVVIFIVTLTIAGPAFPVLIIALVPIRLFLMNRIWNRETLRYVDGWACRDGTPEGDEDDRMMEKARLQQYGHQEKTRTPVDEEAGFATGATAIHDNNTTPTNRHEMIEIR